MQQLFRITMSALFLLFSLYFWKIIHAESLLDGPQEVSFSDYAKDKDVFSKESLQKFYEELERLSLPSITTNSASASATINDYADSLITEVQKFLSEKSLDQVELPDVSFSFKKKIVITYQGLLKLTNGYIKNLPTITRNGDVTVTYANKYIKVHVPLGFNSLNIKYRYKAKIMKIGPSGTVTGKIKSTAFYFTVGFNLTSHTVELNDFQITNVGSVKLSFSGNALIDWLLKIITNLVVPHFKNTVKNIVEKDIYKVIVQLVDTLNVGIQNIFN